MDQTSRDPFRFHLLNSPTNVCNPLAGCVNVRVSIHPRGEGPGVLGRSCSHVPEQAGVCRERWPRAPREFLPLHLCRTTTKGTYLCIWECLHPHVSGTLHEGPCACAHTGFRSGRVCFQLHGVCRRDPRGKLHYHEHPSPSCQPFVAC